MKEVFERERRKLSAKEPDKRQKRRGFDDRLKVVSSAVGLGALAVLSAKKAKAEIDSTQLSLGTPFSPEINDFIWISSSELYPQLITGITKYEFTITIPNGYEGYGDVSKVSFQIQDDVNNNGIIIKQLGAITPVSEASNPNYSETSYLEINRGDEDVSKIFTTGYSWIDVNGTAKWDEYVCPMFRVLHPSKDKNELKIMVLNTSESGAEICGDVYRVQLNATDYCKEKVLDSQESSKAPCIISAPETENLIAIEAYKKPPVEAYPNFLIARKINGTLLHLKRGTDGIWTKENPQQGAVDFEETVSLKAMLERTTPNGREITILVITDMSTLKAIALEQQPESTDDNPIWKEVPVTMTQDPTIIYDELDSDGDGVKNGVDNCPGTKNPDQLDLNSDGYGDACASADCKDSGGYPWEEGATTTTNSSGLTVCKSDLVPGFSAYVMPDQSMIHSDKDVILDEAGNISAQAGQTLVYFHTQKAGTEALPAKKMIFPAGNSLEIEMYSTQKLDGSQGTGTLNYTDFLGNPVEITFDGPTNWKSDGVIVGGELGVEGSYYKATVGNENVVVGCPPVCGAELPAPQPEPQAEPAQAEPAQTAEFVAEPFSQAEQPVQVEPPPAQAEIPMPTAEPKPDAISVAPDIYPAEPDAGAETAEEAGGVVVLPVEPVAEPTQDVSPDTAKNPDATPGPDISNPDIVPLPTDAQSDTLPDSQPETLQQPDSKIGQDSASATETPNQSDSAPESSNPDIPQSTDSALDAHQIGSPDASQDSAILKDTSEKPTPEEKSEGSGGGGGCSLIAEPAHYPYLNLKQNIEINPLNAVMVAAVIARAVLMVRKAVQRKI